MERGESTVERIAVKEDLLPWEYGRKVTDNAKQQQLDPVECSHTFVRPTSRWPTPNRSITTLDKQNTTIISTKQSTTEHSGRSMWVVQWRRTSCVLSEGAWMGGHASMYWTASFSFVTVVVGKDGAEGTIRCMLGSR
jgi:hypothetical protein